MLITIEGPDKAGKTTQIEMLQKYAKKKKKNWVFTRNPGGTDLGNRLREILLDADEHISDIAELMIYLADRAHHVSEFIDPEIEKGNIVICDRFIDSTVAYQGYGRLLDTELIERMNNLVCKNHEPELTIMLMVSPQVAEERAGDEEADRLESQSKLFFTRVRNGYNEIARKNPLRIKIIVTDNMSPDEVHKQVIDLIETKLATVAA